MRKQCEETFLNIKIYIMNILHRLFCVALVAMVFGSLLNDLRCRKYQSPEDLRVWIEWRDTYIPPTDARNVA